MTQHFSEADLLDTFYMQPGQSMPVMMHLADCADCAARYERLDRKLRSLATCAHDDKPETFWARQRMLVMRKIDAQHVRTSSMMRLSRVAAAAALVLMLGGGIVLWEEGSKAQKAEGPNQHPTQTVALTDLATTRPADNPTTTDDPWESEELSEFQPVVAWESWVEPSNGDKSL